jgi:hypothetical protein
MSRRVTQTSNTFSPELAAHPDMETILATVDPEIIASQLDHKFVTASIPAADVPTCVSKFPLAANMSSLSAELVIGELK